MTNLTKNDGGPALRDYSKDARRWKTFLQMIDPDKVPGGFTVYYAINGATDQLCYPLDVTDLVDEHIAARSE
jgi:hypothetical protein